MKMRIVFLLVVVACSHLCESTTRSSYAGDPLTESRIFLDQHSIVEENLPAPDDYDAIRAEVSATRDPGTKLHVFVFALAGRHRNQLSPGQRVAAEAIIARRQSSTNWHDVRNVVRVHAQITMWKYAAARDAQSAAALRSEWDDWTDMRLRFMFQEFAHRERFQREMWSIYTDEQRERIVSGQWDNLVKKNVGHGRLFSADKQVVRELGKPIDKTAFDHSVAVLEDRWKPMLAEYQAVAAFERRREFAMDRFGEPFALASWHEYENVFRAFATAECESIRELVQAGYSDDPELDAKVTAHVSDLRSGMIEKYKESIPAFLRRLNLAP